MNIRLLLPAAFLACALFSRAEKGNWIAVTAPALKQAVQPLGDQRKAEGWRVTLIEAQADMAPAAQQIAALAAKGGPCCVVLAGDFRAGEYGVPTGRGEQLRMKGQLSDFPWTSAANVEAGRIPARDAKEAAVMVRKILTWPVNHGKSAAFPSAMLIAGHHGAPQAFEKMADGLTNSLAQRLTGKLPPGWRMEGAVHIDGSPWQISGSDIPDVTRSMMTRDATLLAYMGHSFAGGAVSKDAPLLSVRDWSGLPADGPRPGLFFTCGCNSCELDADEESFGFAAMRAPGGPPAVIGSHGITWAAMGYLAMQGLINRVAAEPAPQRLGTLWLGVQEGLRKGEISATEFAMLDMADGTGGSVPLADQRLEHLESWMLLGDPAMPLLPAASGITVKAGTVSAGLPLEVSGTVPAALNGKGLRVTLERQPASLRKDLPAVPGTGTERLKATRERRRMSQDVVLATANSAAEAGAFRVSVPLPASLPAGPWILRVESTLPPVAGMATVVK